MFQHNSLIFLRTVPSLDGLLESGQRRGEHTDRRLRTLSSSLQGHAQEAGLPGPLHREEVHPRHRRLSGCDPGGRIGSGAVRSPPGFRPQSSPAHHRPGPHLDRDHIARISGATNSQPALVAYHTTSRWSRVRRISVQSENDQFQTERDLPETAHRLRSRWQRDTGSSAAASQHPAG